MLDTVALPESFTIIIYVANQICAWNKAINFAE